MSHSNLSVLMFDISDLKNVEDKKETYCVEIGETDSPETVRHKILQSCRIPNTDTLVLKV